MTIDTLRADHLGAYGYPRGVSPFLDDVAGRAVVFETAISSSSHTAPSHASLFTSLQPAQHRVQVNGEHLDDRLLTIAEVMSEAGYRSAAFTPVLFLSGLAAGFAEFSVSDGYEAAPAVLDRAAAWLDAQPPGADVFVWVHLYDVHEWMTPGRLDRGALAWVKQNADLQRNRLRMWLRKNHGLPMAVDEEQRNIVSVINRYDGQLLAVDRALASFFERLDAREMLGGTVALITSDHGEGLGNHYFMGHGQYVYEEQIRVPLLIYAADGRFPPGRVVEMVRLIDLAPTIAELAHTSLSGQPIRTEGRSLVPLLENHSAPWAEEEAFSQRRPADERRLRLGWSEGEVFAVRGSRHKLILNTLGTCEAFDLDDDPFELDNLCEPSVVEYSRQIKNATELLELMEAQGSAFQSGLASPEVIEELKALGYL